MSEATLEIQIQAAPGEQPVVIKWTREQEMEAFDMLGPLLRATMKELPGNVMAFPIVQECVQKDLNPNEPYLDAVLSQNLRTLVAHGLQQDKNAMIIEQAMVPLRAKRTRRDHRSY